MYKYSKKMLRLETKISDYSIKKVSIFLICIMPFINNYNTPFFTYVLLTFLVLSIVLKIIKCRYLEWDYLLLYDIYLTMITIISGVLYSFTDSVSLNRSIATIILVLFGALAIERRDIWNIINIYKRIAELAILFFVVQLLFYYVFNRALMFRIPFLPLKDELEMAFGYLEAACSYGMLFPRFPGPFSEPSIYAAYVIPLLIIYLYDDVKKNIYKIILLCITVYMSTSGLGFVMLIIEFFLFVGLNSLKNRKKLLLLPFIFVLLIILFSVAYNINPTVKGMVDTLFVSDSTSASKADYRIYRGFEYFIKMPVISKIFGIGLYNATSFAKISQISTQYDLQGVFYEYLNGITQVLIYSGLIGTVVFALFLIKVYPKRSDIGIALFGAYVMVILATGMLFDSTAMIYLLILICISKQDEGTVFLQKL